MCSSDLCHYKSLHNCWLSLHVTARELIAINAQPLSSSYQVALDATTIWNCYQIMTQTKVPQVIPMNCHRYSQTLCLESYQHICKHHCLTDQALLSILQFATQLDVIASKDLLPCRVTIMLLRQYTLQVISGQSITTVRSIFKVRLMC